MLTTLKPSVREQFDEFCRAHSLAPAEMVGVYLLRLPGTGWTLLAVAAAIRASMPNAEYVTPELLRETNRRLDKYDLPIYNYLRRLAKRFDLIETLKQRRVSTR